MGSSYPDRAAGSGLEVDQFVGNQEGLEVNTPKVQPDFHPLSQNTGTEKASYGAPGLGIGGATTERGTGFGRSALSKVLLGLSIVLAILVIVLGVLYGQAKNTISSKSEQICNNDGPPLGANNATSLPPSTTTTQSLTQTASITSTAAGSPTPSNECASLGNQFRTGSPGASGIDSQTFTVFCDADYAGNDMMGIYMYNFESCMQACTRYNADMQYYANTTCYGVSYQPDYGPPQFGNCFLKWVKDAVSDAKPGTASGWLLTS